MPALEQVRAVERIYAAPSAHWVGDGFLVHSMFSHGRADKRTDPFLLLDYGAPHHFKVNHQAPLGVSQHPHKGFETVTIAYSGEIAHRDSSGSGGVIQQGDAQWMTAARGIIHEEFHSAPFSQTGGPLEMVQLWVNLPARYKLTPARYQHLLNTHIPSPELQDDAGQMIGHIRLIAGHHHMALEGLAKTFAPINLWDVTINACQAVDLPIPTTHNVLILVRHGIVIFNHDPSEMAGPAQVITFIKESCRLPESNQAQAFDQLSV